MKSNVLVKAMLGLIGVGVFAVGLAVAGSTSGYPPQNATVGTNSVQIVAPRNALSISTRATGTVYALNAMVRVYSNGTTKLATPYEYSCITAGTSATNQLTNWVNNADVTDGTVVWRPIKQNRQHVTIVNDSDTTIYLAYSADAVLNKGIRLNASGGTLVTDWAGAIYAIASATNKNVSILQD